MRPSGDPATHCRVEIVLTTHDVGGLSDADGELAAAIDQISWSFRPARLGIVARPLSLFLHQKEDDDMAGGWAPDGAVQDQIDDTVKDAVEAARLGLRGGEAATHCEECGEPIPEKRRQALPGARTCVGCQSARDRTRQFSVINRRGSKDSQLR